MNTQQGMSNYEVFFNSFNIRNSLLGVRYSIYVGDHLGILSNISS